MERIKKLAPPGIPLPEELRIWIAGLVLALLWSFRYFLAYGNERSDMYWYDTETGIRHITKDFVMPDFADLFEGSLSGFYFVAMCVLLAAVYHYLYYSSGGSHALCVIRRLPDRTYLAKTCLTLPVLASLATLMIAFLIMLADFGLYMLMTPEECLRPDQWAKLWSF